MPDFDPPPDGAETLASQPPAIDPPPFLGTWSRVYAAVLAYLCGIIVVLFLVTRALTF